MPHENWYDKYNDALKETKKDSFKQVKSLIDRTDLNDIETLGDGIVGVEKSTVVNEVVKIADDIKELDHKYFAKPANLYPLPEGYAYRFSGYFGQVLGICKTGI